MRIKNGRVSPPPPGACVPACLSGIMNDLRRSISPLPAAKTGSVATTRVQSHRSGIVTEPQQFPAGRTCGRTSGHGHGHLCSQQHRNRRH